MGKLRSRVWGRLIKVRQLVSGIDRIQTRNAFLRSPGSTHCVTRSPGKLGQPPIPSPPPEWPARLRSHRWHVGTWDCGVWRTLQTSTFSYQWGHVCHHSTALSPATRRLISQKPSSFQVIFSDLMRYSITVSALCVLLECKTENCIWSQF